MNRRRARLLPRRAPVPANDAAVPPRHAVVVRNCVIVDWNCVIVLRRYGIPSLEPRQHRCGRRLRRSQRRTRPLAQRCRRSEHPPVTPGETASSIRRTTPSPPATASMFGATTLLHDSASPFLRATMVQRRSTNLFFLAARSPCNWRVVSGTGING